MFENLVGKLNIAICDDMESDARKTEDYLKRIFFFLSMKKLNTKQHITVVEKIF